MTSDCCGTIAVILEYPFWSRATMQRDLNSEYRREYSCWHWSSAPVKWRAGLQSRIGALWRVRMGSGR